MAATPPGAKLAQKIRETEDVTINLLLTRRCNYSCRMCMYASGPKMPADPMRREDLTEIKGFLDEISLSLKPETNISVNLIGGEPTLDMEHLENVLSTVASWERPQRDDCEWTNGISLEMTTNGWWLESYKDTVAFAKAVWTELSEERLIVRISNSAYHDEFRSPALSHLFKDEPRESYGYGGGRKTSKLEDYLQELGYEGCTEDEDGNYNEPQDLWLLEELRKAAEACHLYIDSKLGGPEKVSPVGRAKTNGIGWQDGECHATSGIKFTFMPTKDGERPGRLYDPCCNGGKVPLGFADEGLGLLIKRALFMEALHKEFPKPKGTSAPSPLQGDRCRQCPSFGAKWLKENRRGLERKVAALTRKAQIAT